MTAVGFGLSAQHAILLEDFTKKVPKHGYRHKPGQNFHGKKNKGRALNIKFGLDKVL